MAAAGNLHRGNYFICSRKGKWAGMKYIFIENPIAGNKNKQMLFKQVQSSFRLIDDKMIIEETDYHGHAKEIARKYALEYSKECVIVSCGGDGTVHEIANGLAHTETPLMILPFGTANDFAKKIYGTKKIDAFNVVKSFGLHNGRVRYKTKPVDLIDYNGEKCINVMSFGLDTKVETIGRKLAGKFKFLGQQAYNLAVVPSVLQSMHYRINIEANCIDKSGKPYVWKLTPADYTLFAICNASYYGGGFCPAPDSKLDDGILDFCIIENVNLAQGLPLIPKYSAGTANEDASDKIHMGYITGGRIWSADGNPLPGNCDGENFDYKEVNFNVEKHALNLCVADD